MYNDIYDLPKPRVDITFTKFLVVLNTVLVTLIIPILAFTFYQRQDNTFLNNQKELVQATTNTQSSGRVAGVSTTDVGNKIEVPFLNELVDLNSQSGLLIIVGIILMAISLILFLFLLLENIKIKKYT